MNYKTDDKRRRNSGQTAVLAVIQLSATITPPVLNLQKNVGQILWFLRFLENRNRNIFTSAKPMRFK